MQHLSKLLEIEDSQLAWVLRLGLHGLRIQLQEALKEVTTDPGKSSCQELVRELDQLLQPQKRKKLEELTPPPHPYGKPLRVYTLLTLPHLGRGT